MIAAGLIEHFTSHSIAWPVYLWFLVASFVIALMVQGADQYRRLQPRLVIRDLERSEWPFERFGYTGVGYHFSVESLSEAQSLEEVQAQITSIDPVPSYIPLPIPMKIKHRNWDVKQISLPPQWKEQIDLIVGPNSDPRSKQPLRIVYNADPKEGWEDLPSGKYRIGVRVGAKNIKPVTAVFEAWVAEDGDLRCILL